MRVVWVILIGISGAAEPTAPLLTCIVVSWFADSQTVGRRLTRTRPKSWPRARSWPRGLGGSLALWVLACGTAVVVLHEVTSDLGPTIGAFPTGVATLVMFVSAAAIVMHRRIAKALPHAFAAAASRHKLQQNTTSHNVSHALSTSRSIKPKTWQRMHIAVAIGAVLPLWWHCDLGRASTVDLLLKAAAILLLTSGFLGVVITDFTRWRLLSPNFSPRLSDPDQGVVHSASRARPAYLHVDYYSCDRRVVLSRRLKRQPGDHDRAGADTHVMNDAHMQYFPD